MSCGNYADLTGVICCPECKTNTMTYPLRDLVQALIQLGRAQCQLLKDIEQRMVLLSQDVKKLNDQIDQLDADDEADDYVPTLKN